MSQLKLLYPHHLTVGAGYVLTLGTCPVCGRIVRASSANKVGGVCRYEGSQFDRAGNLVWDARHVGVERAVRRRRILDLYVHYPNGLPGGTTPPTMMKPMTFKELKKLLTPGLKLSLVRNITGKQLGARIFLRIIEKTVLVFGQPSGTESHAQTKDVELFRTVNGFGMLDDKKRVLAEYEFLSSQNES